MPRCLLNVLRHAFLIALIGPTVATVSTAGERSSGHAHVHPEAADAAIGEPGVAARIDRTVTVDMTDDMRFTPAEIAVRQGETVRFALRNAGRIKHELVLGTERELKAHDVAMARNPEMEHDEPKMLTLAPGRSGDIVWRFTKGGRVDFACLQPGHYAAGMKGQVTVATGGARGAMLDGPRTGEKARFQTAKDDGGFVVVRVDSTAKSPR